MSYFVRCLYILLLLSAALSAGAQGGRPGGGGFGGFGSGGGFGNFGGSGSRSGTISSGKLTLDTSDIHFFYADNPLEIIPFSDSLLGNLHQYDPIRQQPDIDYASLGNLGSAARPLFFQPTWRRGFEVGLNQFDLYQLHTADLRYYKITQAYTQAGYSQGSTQNDALFDVKFSRNFADGLNLSIEHRRIDNTGAYDFQKASSSSMGAGLWYHDKYHTYDAFLSFVSNSIEQQNNGGTDEPLEGAALIPAFQVGVNLESANSRYANKELAYTQYFYLNRIFSEEGQSRRTARKTAKAQSRTTAPDSTVARPAAPAPRAAPTPQNPADRPGLRPPPTNAPANAATQAQRPAAAGPPPANAAPPIDIGKRAFTLYHQIAWRTESYKFADKTPDSLFYGDFYTDSRGLRHYVERRKLENTFKLQTFKLRQSSSAMKADGESPQAESRDLLEAGLVHSVNFLQLEPLDTKAIHNVFLTGRFNFSPGDRLEVNSYAHLGLGANAGDFRLSGNLTLDLKKIGRLQLEAVNQLYSPTLLQNRFFVTEREIWNNDFAKTLETTLSASYSLPSIHFSTTGKYHLLNNFIYFDTLGLPRQSGTFSILQLLVQKDFHLGSFHLENLVGLQQVGSDVLPLPSLYSKHSLFFEGLLFKKVMLTKIGLDARLAGAHRPPGYQPLTGQFILQNRQSLPFTPLVDAFLSFRVKTFRFFVKIENLLAQPANAWFFQTADYPLPFGLESGGLRLGINWRLVD
jgi:hypothetical protein